VFILRAPHASPHNEAERTTMAIGEALSIRKPVKALFDKYFKASLKKR